MVGVKVRAAAEDLAAGHQWLQPARPVAMPKYHRTTSGIIGALPHASVHVDAIQCPIRGPIHVAVLPDPEAGEGGAAGCRLIS